MKKTVVIVLVELILLAVVFLSRYVPADVLAYALIAGILFVSNKQGGKFRAVNFIAVMIITGVALPMSGRELSLPINMYDTNIMAACDMILDNVIPAFLLVPFLTLPRGGHFVLTSDKTFDISAKIMTLSKAVAVTAYVAAFVVEAYAVLLVTLIVLLVLEFMQKP